MELDKTLTLSSAYVHPKERTYAGWLTYTLAEAPWHRRSEWACFLYIPEEAVQNAHPEARATWPSLFACLDYARSLGCRYLRIDRDAPTSPEVPLPTYPDEAV